MRSARLSKVLWMAALVPLFLAAVLPSRVATLICRFTGAAMEVEACCPTGDEAPRDPAGSIRPVAPAFRPPPIALKQSLLI